MIKLATKPLLRDVVHALCLYQYRYGHIDQTLHCLTLYCLWIVDKYLSFAQACFILGEGKLLFVSKWDTYIIYNLVFFIFWSASCQGQSQAGEEDWIRTDEVRQSSCVWHRQSVCQTVTCNCKTEKWASWDSLCDQLLSDIHQDNHVSSV